MGIDSGLLARRPALPVLGIAGIAFATTWLRSDDTQWRLILVAVSLTAVLAWAGLADDRQRRPVDQNVAS